MELLIHDAVPGDPSASANESTSATGTATEAADPALSIPVQRPGRSRWRMITPLDIVTFQAACPACGKDTEWTQERRDTRLVSTLSCPC